MEASTQPLIRPDQRKTFSQIGLTLSVIIAVTVVMQLTAKYEIHYFMPQWERRSWYLWVLTFAPLYLFAVPLGIALFTRMPEVRIVPRKMRFRDLFVFLLMCFPIMYSGNLTGTYISTALHSLLGTEIRTTLDPYLFGSSVWLNALFLVILAPVIEEFVFRRLLIDRVRPYGEGVSVLISASLFGLFHGNFNQFFYAAGLGAIFAFVYVKTGRLRYTIFMHMVINLLGGVITPLLVSSLDLTALSQMRTDGQMALRFLSEHGTQFILLGIYGLASLALTIAGLVLLIVRRKAFFMDRSSAVLIEKGVRFRTMFVNWGMAFFAAGVIFLFVLSLV